MAWNLEGSAAVPGKLKGDPRAPHQASSKSIEDGKQNVHRANAPNSLTSDAGSTPETTGSERSSRPEGQKSTGSPGSNGGGLADYFSALFDESFCSHKYKFVGSKIYSSGNFQDEHGSQGRDGELSMPGPEDYSGASVDSSEYSSDFPRIPSSSALSEGEPWGWFDEMDDVGGDGSGSGGMGVPTPAAPKSTPPYILTESLSAQRLWRETAGKRPRQPSQEREFFEEQWAKNFSDSKVDYSTPLQSAEATAAKKRVRNNSKVLYRAASPFGSAVSKSFKCDNCGQISSIMVHIPKFQIVQTGSDVHAEYLIVVGLGSVTLGVWRRFSEFKRLATKLAKSAQRYQFHNALCSWRCLRERQRWFRCLDRDYLILKTFLLERFLHDLVFESMSPNTVRDFLGVL